MLASLALPEKSQRTNKTQAALNLLTRHADALAHPPGLMSSASEYFAALLLCRSANNKAIRQLVVPALEEGPARYCSPCRRVPFKSGVQSALHDVASTSALFK